MTFSVFLTSVTQNFVYTIYM